MVGPRRVAVRLALIGALVAAPAAAHAAGDRDLAAARQLFAAALKDEEAGRLGDALEKYRAVQRTKDTPAVRFRIAATLEGLGKTTQAIDAYDATIRLATANGGDTDVVQVAHKRIDVLDAKLAHVAIDTHDGPPVEVAIDGQIVPTEKYRDVRVDPGDHVVSATASGMRPFRAPINAAPGAKVDVVVELVRDASPPKESKDAPPPEPTSWRTVGIVVGASGAALAIGGAVVLALRAGTIADLKTACPAGDCAVAREGELESDHDRAKTEGPVGAVLLGVGLAALAAGGAFFVLGAGQRANAAVSATPQGLALRVTRRF